MKMRILGSVVALAIIALVFGFGCHSERESDLTTGTDVDVTLSNPEYDVTLAIYDYLLTYSVNKECDSCPKLTMQQLISFEDDMAELDIDITEIRAYDWAALDTCDIDSLDPEPIFIIVEDTLYFTEEAEPPPNPPEDFWECVKDCYEECIAECDPDENYWECCRLCEKECKIICSAQFPKGRWVKKPSS